MNARLLVALMLLPLVARAGVKVAGTEFVPKDLIFAAPESKSRATAEGALPDQCKWEFLSETRIGRQEDGQGCVRYFYKTSVTLIQSCPAPREKPVLRGSDRITSQGPFCPDHGKVQPPNTESKALSSGTTSEGKHQDTVLQPDGTRITLVYDEAGVVALIAYPDGSGDMVKLP
jgi:hypothetical protein